MAQQQQLRIDVPVSGYLFIYEQATTSVVACLNAEGRTIPFSGRNQRGCAEFNFTMESELLSPPSLVAAPLLSLDVFIIF